MHLFLPFFLNGARFGRESFDKALHMVNVIDSADVDWTQFKYVVFDIPNHPGPYHERYSVLSTRLID